MSNRPFSATASALAVVVCVAAFALAFAVFGNVRTSKGSAGPVPEEKADRPTSGPADSESSVDKKGDAGRKRAKPDKDLAPGQVVRIVVDALKQNDKDDTGIAVTFDFASPQNQRMTGPLKRFIPMVKSPAYAPLLNHKSATFGKVVVDDEQDAAEMWVVLTDAKGQKVAYVFRLSKQTGEEAGERKDCWLTDGVMPVDPEKLPQEPKLDDPANRNKPDEA